MSASSQKVTKLLLDWRNGDGEALDRLMPLIYEEQRRMANHYMRNERRGRTLRRSALVNEAYLRLADHALRRAAGGADCARRGAR